MGLKSQVKALESELESLRKDNIAHIDMESLSTELAALRAEREEEKKELQILYDRYHPHYLKKESRLMPEVAIILVIKNLLLRVSLVKKAH